MHVQGKGYKNQWSKNFTREVWAVVSRLEREHPNFSFTNFAVDEVSLERNDVVTYNAKFMDRTHGFASAVENKNFIENDRLQMIRGSCSVTIGNGNILLQAGVSKYLIVIKDFASDKKVEILF